ncbi:ErpC protein [Borreliella andersonii]|uniref:ErpC protein n=1 Tax=Borrelia andersonii TaxID=42109 RepID=UPI003AB62D4D
MNKKIKIFIICTVVVLISSCKNYHVSSKDLEQNAKGKVQGFVDKILDPTKDKITSSGSKVDEDEVAKKLQEEELMQGDDSNNSQLSPPPVLPASGQDNLPVLKAEQQIGGQEEGKKEEVKPEEEKVEDKKEEVKLVKLEEKKLKVEDKKEIDKKEKTKKEIERIEKKEKQKRQREERQKREREKEQRQEQEKKRLREEEEKKRREEEESQAKKQIESLISKIDKINKYICDIEHKTLVESKEIRDEITVPIYDDFTDDDNSIFSTWDFKDGTNSGLGKLLKDLRKTRSSLRTKLNEGNQENNGIKEPNLKENVKIDEIKSDLEKLKSELEKVKEYLKDKSNFETIKGYIYEE